MSRAASESSLGVLAVLSFVRIFKAIAKAAHRLDEMGVQFLAQASDENLDRVGIAVEILIVQMLDQFGARYHLAAMMGEIGKQAVFQAR